jgi:peptidyl-prolyl cis-trans isomerase D
MISGRIVQGEAAKLKLNVSDDELQNAIRDYAAFQRDGRFIGAEEYERLLAYNHMSVVDFEDSLRKDLLADKLKQLVTAGQILDPAMLREDFRKENDKAELDYIAFRVEEIKEEPAVGEAELRDFYAKNPRLFQSAEKRSGEVLALKFADFKKELQLKEGELFAYYQQNKAMFKVAGKTKVSRIWVAYDAQTREDVLKRMEEAAAGLTPTGFAAKAREISGDEKAKDGGDWGYWGWQNFSPQEKTMIDKLSAGNISSPVDAGQGFSLLFVSEKVAETQEAYDAVKARIRSLLENEALKKLAVDKINQAYGTIKKAESLKAGAGKLAARVIDSGLLTQGQAIKDVDEMGYISQKLFTLRENEVSEPMEFPEGVAVARLTRIVKPQTETFDAARPQVEKELRNAKKLELQTARAAKVAVELNRLADAKKIEDYLKGENLKTESTTYQRGNRLADLPATPGLDDTVFALAEGAYSQPLALQSAAAIVKLKSKKIVSDADFAREREAYIRRRLDEAKNSRFGSFLMSKKYDYKIRFNAEIFEKIKEEVISRFR